MRRPYLVPKPKPADAETKTIKRLRQQVAQIKTLAQFEDIIASGNPENEGPLRKLITPMLPADLPCCGQFMLSQRLGKPAKHGARCPCNRLVTVN